MPQERNRQVIRQWTILRTIGSRRDATIPALAQDLGVSTRTIRRDLAALEEAGFPIVDEAIHDDGRKTWRLLSRLDEAA